MVSNIHNCSQYSIPVNFAIYKVCQGTGQGLQGKGEGLLKLLRKLFSLCHHEIKIISLLLHNIIILFYYYSWWFCHTLNTWNFCLLLLDLVLNFLNQIDVTTPWHQDDLTLCFHSNDYHRYNMRTAAHHHHNKHTAALVQ